MTKETRELLLRAEVALDLAVMLLGGFLPQSSYAEVEAARDAIHAEFAEG